MVVHSHCDYFDSISFPAVAELAMRVNKLGKSSVTYEVGLFEKGNDKVRCVGEFGECSRVILVSVAAPRASALLKGRFFLYYRDSGAQNL